MTQTYDPSSQLGLTRLLSQDTNVPNAIFEDEEYTALLNLSGSVPLLAAASALDIIAANEIYVQKRIKLLDLTTDGVQEGQQLHILAQSYRDRVASGIDDPTGMFDFAEQVVDEFTERERLMKQLLRLQDQT